MMTPLSVVLIYIALLVAVKADDLTKEPPGNRFPIRSIPNNGMVRVASVSGIASRNGRVSSLGSIKFYGPESLTVNRNTGLYHPFSVSAEKDGHFASGSVQFYPGSRGVSASASAGYMPNYKWPVNGPPSSSFFFQPTPEVFQIPRNVDPWFGKDIFKSFSPPNVNAFRNDWMYPNYNPFVNFWR